MSIARSPKGQHFFKDNDGRVVIYQRPNIFIYGWVATKLLSLVFSSAEINKLISYSGKAILICWAILELLDGVNYFRRLLGFTVFISAIYSIAK